MRTITVTEKYKAVNEGRMSKTEFVRQMRQAYPMYVSPVGTYESTVQILKNKNMLFEAKEQEVDDTFKYSDDSLRRALDIELEAMGLMSQESISMDDQVKAKKKAVANLKKDPLHYYHLISGDSSKVNKHDKEVEVKRGALEKDTFNDMKKATLKEAKLMTEGTRALVGYLSGDRLTTTYNHYDGYPSNLGKGLEAHYNDDDKAKDIAMKGYITYLNPETGEIESTHKEAPGKLVLPDDPEQRAREIAEEIDKFGADFGYVWDDNTNKWITIKNTGIRSMIDQIIDKLDMVNIHSGEKINSGIEEVDSSLDPYEDKKEIIRQVIELIKSSMPADNETIKSFIRTHYDDIINLGDDQAILDEFQEFLSVNTDYVDEAEPLDTTAAYDNDEETQDMIDKMRKDGKDSDDFVDEKKVSDFAPSPNSNIPDANAEEYDVATAFKKAGVDMSKPVMVIHSYGSAAFGGNDKDEMSAEAAIKKLEAERQDRSKQYTDDGEEVPEDHHGYEFENSSVLEEEMPEGHEYKLGYFQLGDADFAITQEKSGVSEKKGKDLDGDGDIDGDDYKHAKDKAIKKAMGKDEQLKEAIKKIIKSSLLNEAATAKLSDIGDKYGDYKGMQVVINDLENIVTDMEGYFSKVRERVQSSMDKIGQIETPDGMKVGAFLAPAIESAFFRDLNPVRKLSARDISLPQVKTISSADIAAAKAAGDIEEQPKQTMFGINEKGEFKLRKDL